MRTICDVRNAPILERSDQRKRDSLVRTGQLGSATKSHALYAKAYTTVGRPVALLNIEIRSRGLAKGGSSVADLSKRRLDRVIVSDIWSLTGLLQFLFRVFAAGNIGHDDDDRLQVVFIFVGLVRHGIQAAVAFLSARRQSEFI